MGGMEFGGAIAGARENKTPGWGYDHLKAFRNRLQGEQKVCRRWMMSRLLGQPQGKTLDNSLMFVVDLPKVVILLAPGVRRVYEWVSYPPLDYAVVG